MKDPRVIRETAGGVPRAGGRTAQMPLGVGGTTVRDRSPGSVRTLSYHRDLTFLSLPWRGNRPPSRPHLISEDAHQ